MIYATDIHPLINIGERNVHQHYICKQRLACFFCFNMSNQFLVVAPEADKSHKLNRMFIERAISRYHSLSIWKKKITE